MDAAPQQPDSERPDPVPAAVKRAASGAELSAREEADALDFLLGPTRALEYDVKVQLETDAGLQPLTVHFRQLDPQTFDKIDAANRRGDGPFSKLDVHAFQCEVIAAATLYVEGGSGRRVEIRSAEFMGGAPSPAVAIGLRFKNQGGLLGGIVDEIRAVSGFSPDRIGTAQRVLVEAGKG